MGGADAARGYKIGDLPYWLDDELWVVELDGELRRDVRLTRASRGRLVRRIDGWDADTANAMALACAERARTSAVAVLRDAGRTGDAAALAEPAAPGGMESVARRIAGSDRGPVADAAAYVADALFYARDASTPGGAAAVSAYIAARAVACAAPRESYADTFAAEREWQAAWLRERVRLTDGEPE